jgi:hypothetical protein
MATCPHGFPEGDCLICQTLGKGSGKQATQGRTKLKNRDQPVAGALGALGGVTSPLPARQPLTSQQITVNGDGSHGRRGGRRTFWAVAGAFVVGAVLVWAFGGLFTMAVHIAEYVALAAVAGWAGYKLGYAQGGRHSQERPGRQRP